MPINPKFAGDRILASTIPIIKDMPLPTKLSMKLQETPLSDFDLSELTI